MRHTILISIKLVDGTDTTFSIDQELMHFTEYGFMYTVLKATNPKERRTILIPWDKIAELIIDDTVEEKENGSK